MINEADQYRPTHKCMDDLFASFARLYWETKDSDYYILARGEDPYPFELLTPMGLEDIKYKITRIYIGEDNGACESFYNSNIKAAGPESCICSSYDLFNHGCPSARGKRCRSQHD